jgi:hypothetical protein
LLAKPGPMGIARWLKCRRFWKKDKTDISN